MINSRSFQVLFRRYSALHRSIPLLPRKIRSSNGALLARIEKEQILGNMRLLRGWTFAQQIIISAPDRVLLTVSPSIPRGDVQAQYGGSLQSGFELQLPCLSECCTISFVRDDQTVTRPLRTPGRILYTLETLRLATSLGWAGLRGLPSVYIYLTSSDAQTRNAAKQKLKQLLQIGQVFRRDHLFGLQELGIKSTSTNNPAPHRQKMTIVLPVFNAYDLLCECLDRVVEHTDLDWHLIVVEDCSTDPRIRPFLRKWAAAQPCGQVRLLENETNTGFIGSVNRGFSEALMRSTPVVLLNSDALVPKGWASRILAPLEDPSIASVTPLSNDAEILNAPVICARTLLTPGQADWIDAQAQALLVNAPPVTLPTGVGFCMAIAPAWLARVPQFDPIFGRGYGEEVDWCRKIIKMEGRHVGVPNLFVEHRGGESFGSEEKRRLIEANGRIVTQRYTSFDAEVQEFIINDPLIGPRLTLGLAAIAAIRTKVPVYLCHSLGGGAEDAMMRQIHADLEQGLPSVVLRVGGRFRYGLELHTIQGISHGSIDDEIVLEHLWRALPQLNLIYICGVGDLDATSLPIRMVRWTASAQARLTIEIHDFFPLSPSYTLLDRSGQFTGPPLPETHTDPVHTFYDQAGQKVDLVGWQGRWRDAMLHAEDIIVFTRNSRDLLLAIWPEIASKISIRPHPPLYAVPPITRVPQVPAKTIGVLGNIGRQKGAEILKHLSRRLLKARGERLVVIGNIDPNFPLSPSALVHGNYTRKDVATLAETYGIDCWLIPSVWPETFSFTTREALATGLPVWCFDLGAQAEALRAAGQGDHVLPLPSSPEQIDGVLKQILSRTGSS